MSEKNNPFEKNEKNEIDRIQEEIEKDLIGETKKEEESEILDLTEENNKSLKEIDTNMGKREIVETKKQEFPEETLPPEDMDSQFFKETIKNEKTKKEKSKFKRNAVLLLVLAIVGGSAIGAMIPITQSIIIPRIIGEEKSTFEFAEENGEIEDTNELEDKSDSSNISRNLGLKDDFSFADLIDQVEPSVVGITSVKAEENVGGLFSIPGEYPNQGSGIIFDEDNTHVYIVSNNHVTEGAREVLISIEGQEAVPGKYIGKEAQSDLVVLSVEKKDLKEIGIEEVKLAKFGSSEKMRVGDFAIAIGNALGEGNTATFGFISANNKEFYADDKNLTVIQTDAAINPGNSGGPLINLNGEVIGINTVKLASTEVEGMGYAITSDVAKPIIEQLRNQIPKPSLGIRGYTMTKEVAKAYNLPEMGVIVESVLEGSAAETAGIQKSDIITSFGGETVLDIEQLIELVSSYSVGDTVEVKLLRIRDKNESVTVELRLTELKDDDF